MTAAATAPSTIGASQSRTFARRSSGIRSSAISAESTALPRSISTRTPSSDHARSIACITRTASVPIGWSGMSRPPGRLEPHVGTAHLAGELRDALGDQVAVRDDDDADHGRSRSGSRSQDADERQAVRDRHGAQDDDAPRHQALRTMAESPKSSSTERRPSIAWIVTTIRNAPSITKMTGLRDVVEDLRVRAEAADLLDHEVVRDHVHGHEHQQRHAGVRRDLPPPRAGGRPVRLGRRRDRHHSLPTMCSAAPSSRIAPERPSATRTAPSAGRPRSRCRPARHGGRSARGTADRRAAARRGRGTAGVVASSRKPCHALSPPRSIESTARWR